MMKALSDTHKEFYHEQKSSSFGYAHIGFAYH